MPRRSQPRRRVPLEEADFMHKLARAKYHLNRLDELVEEYSASTPVRVARERAGRHWEWRLRIEQQPPREMALVLGDFLYNVRAGLDYLAGDLLPTRYRRSAAFPIFSERVWEIPVAADESPARAGERRRWELIEREAAPDAVQIIKEEHPPSGAPTKREPMHSLMILNRLSNRDRHQRLNLIASGLDAPGSRIEVEFQDGRTEVSASESTAFPFRRALADGARITHLPSGVRAVRASGTIAVVVEVSADWANVAIPGDMRVMWEEACRIGGRLWPYARI